MLFTVALMLFVGTLLYLSLDYRPAVRRVPQIVGFPTLGLLIVILIRDLRDFRRSAEVEDTDEGIQDIVDEETLSDLTVTGDMSDALRLAMLVEDEMPEALSSESQRRLMVFGGWVILFTVGASWFGFLWAVPVGLWLIIYYARRSLLVPTVVAVSTSVILYLLFITFLQVRF